MAIDEKLLNTLARAVRTKADSSKEEITDLAESCIKDLEIAGVYVTDPNDALCKNAIKLYCKGNFGYDEDAAKFRDAYAALKDAMALSGEYQKPEES